MIKLHELSRMRGRLDEGQDPRGRMLGRMRGMRGRMRGMTRRR